MFFKRNTKEEVMIQWNEITSIEGLAEIVKKSEEKPQIIFKHSTRCSISSMAKSRMEKGLEDLSAKADVYYLDLIKYRNISNEIAQRFDVIHESPQVILVKNGQATYDASHQAVNSDTILDHLQ